MHVPWLEAQDRKAVPAGSGSVTVTARAVPGPAFRTTMEYFRTWPDETGFGDPVFVIERSTS